MESARLPFAPAGADRARIGLIALLVGLAAVAWALTGERMQGMDAGPGTDLGGLGFYVTVWLVMMAAMMFPSIAPMVGVYSRLQGARRESGRSAPAGATAIFVAGYLVSWGLAGLLGYAIFDLGRSIAPDAFSWDRGGPYPPGGGIRDPRFGSSSPSAPNAGNAIEASRGIVVHVTRIVDPRQAAA